MARFWVNVSGWEYDILRLLPKEEAKEIYARGFSQWRKRGLMTWWFGPVLFLIAFGFVCLLLLVSIAADAIGLGDVGTILAELVVIKLCHFWAFRHILPKVLRPFIREQLYLIVQQESPADHPLMQLPLPEQETNEHGQA
jgi:hypothetical protein